MLYTILVVILILAILGYPGFGLHSYGAGPSSLLGVVLLILVIWILFGGRL